MLSRRLVISGALAAPCVVLPHDRAEPDAGAHLAALHEAVDAGRLTVPDCGGDWRARNRTLCLVAHLRARGLRGEAARAWLGPYLRWRYGHAAAALNDALASSKPLFGANG